MQDPTLCDCECHQSTTILHFAPCCDKCPDCGKNVWGLAEHRRKYCPLSRLTPEERAAYDRLRPDKKSKALKRLEEGYDGTDTA